VILNTLHKFLYFKLQLKETCEWIFDSLFDFLEEGYGLATVDESVIVRECDVHHRSDLHLAVDGHRPVEGGVHAQDG